VFLEGKIIPNSLELWHRVFLSPDLHLAFDFSGLEAIFLEAEILACYSQKGRILLERVAHTAWDLGYLLYSAWRTLESSYLHHSTVFWRHYQPHTSFFYMYSRSAPFCMRLAIL
jgi:hypothetical protein